MSDSLTIALDTMGGDHAPAVVLRGADIALMRYPAARFLLFGDEARVAPLLAKLPRLARVAVRQGWCRLRPPGPLSPLSSTRWITTGMW